MLGNPRKDGGVQPVAFDSKNATVDNSALYSRQLSIPWSVTWGAAGIPATPQGHGRGLTNSANKVSEHNIYNSTPRLINQNQLPPQTHAPQTRKILSRVVPSLGMSTTGR